MGTPCGYTRLLDLSTKSNISNSTTNSSNINFIYNHNNILIIIDKATTKDERRLKGIWTIPNTQKITHPNKNVSTHLNFWTTPPSFKPTHPIIFGNSPNVLDNIPKYMFT